MRAFFPTRRASCALLLLAACSFSKDALSDEVIEAPAARVVIEPHAGTHWDEFCLRRAAALWMLGERERAVQALSERTGAASEDGRPEGLLAWGLYSLGDESLDAISDSLRSLIAGTRFEPLGRGATFLHDPAADESDLPPSIRAGQTAHPRPQDEAEPPTSRAETRRKSLQEGLEAVRRSEWSEARSHLLLAEENQRLEGEHLDSLATLSEQAVESVWRAWNRASERPGTRLLDAKRLASNLTHWEEAALRVNQDATWGEAFPAFETSRPSESLPASVGSPDSTGLAALRANEHDLRLAHGRWNEAEKALKAEIENVERARRYMERGNDQTLSSLAALDDATSGLDDFLAGAENSLAKLAEIRDVEIARIAERTAGFRNEAAENRLFRDGLVHFHLQGPNGPHLDETPSGFPSPSLLLEEERLLNQELVAWVDSFSVNAPELLRRSHDERWTRDTLLRARALAQALLIERDRAAGFGWLLERRKMLATSSERFAELETALVSSAADIRRFEATILGQRRQLVADALEEAGARHLASDASLSYALAVATQELAESLPESRHAEAARLREDAVSRFRTHLASHPSAAPRSEARYRLADGLLQQARASFHDQVRTFLEEDSSRAVDQAALAPFVDYSEGLAELQTLLEEDPTYERRDVVLYQVGMILAEENSADFAVHLEELVSEHPGSPFVQEARVRLGDEAFRDRRFHEAIQHFEHAAHGDNVEQVAVALYKLGWAYSNQERHDDAATAFHNLLKLHREHPELAESTDIREETLENLVQTLARGGGVEAFARLFPEDEPTDEASRVLSNLGRHLRRFSQFEEAQELDRLWLTRYPTDARALDAAVRLTNAVDANGKRAASWSDRLAHAERFYEDGAWWSANLSDSLRQEADDFARETTKEAALELHHDARDSKTQVAWNQTGALYEDMITRWPGASDVDTLHYYAAEARSQSGDWAASVAHFDAAAESGGPLALDASWQAIATRDQWYEAQRDTIRSNGLGPEPLAHEILAKIQSFVDRAPTDDRSKDLRWRRAHLAWSHDQDDLAETAFADFAARHADDARALDAAQYRSRILHENEEYRRASEAYASAATLARARGADSLAVELGNWVPKCLFREAEVATESKKAADLANAARLFAGVVDRFPEFEESDQALYRSGLAFADAEQPDAAVAAWDRLTAAYPTSEYVRDARLKVADTWEAAKQPDRAALALEKFATDYTTDPDAAPALLRAIDLSQATQNAAKAEHLKTRYLALFPDDLDTTSEILEERAERELSSLNGNGVSALLSSAPGEGATNLSRVLDIASSHPDLVSGDLVARVDYLRGEEARSEYSAARLSQPLGPAVKHKKALLEDTLAQYQSASKHGVDPWNQASVFRIGECLVAFGDDLLESERPDGLSEDDLWAYEEVLEDQSFDFFEKGEAVWRELLVNSDDRDTSWAQQAKKRLWARLATRFFHVAEFEYPRVMAPNQEVTR